MFGPHSGKHPFGGGTAGRGRGTGRPGGRPGGWQQADLPPAADAADWFRGRLPQDWFTDVDVTVDREEILVVGTLATASATASTADATTDTTGAAAENSAAQPSAAQQSTAQAEGTISRFRADTREQRIAIAREAQARYGRTVSWGAAVGSGESRVQALFTHVSAPVMTRLRQHERQVLDTLVDSGVARSRADALAWCVRLVGEHADAWLADLRDAMTEVDRLRSDGPDL